MSPVITPWKAARLLIGLRVIRILNQLSSSWARRGKSKAANKNPARLGTAGKSRGWMMGAFVGFAMLITYANVSRQSLTHIKQMLGVTAHASAPDVSSAKIPIVEATKRSTEKTPRVLSAYAGHRHPVGVLRAAALQVSLGLLAALLVALSNKELAQSEWDVEWLSTLPMSLGTLLGIKIVERTAVNPLGFVSIGPFLFFFAWDCNMGAWSVVIALALTFPLLFFAAAAQTVFETLLRLTQHAARLRNIQALLTVAGVVAMMLSISTGSSAGEFLIRWSKVWPAFVTWTPPGLAVSAISATSTSAAVTKFGILLLQAATVGVAALVVLSARLRFGLVAAGARESNRAVQSTRPARQTTAGNRRWLSAVQRREVRLLSRDRNFAVQTLLLPVMFIGFQVWIGGGGASFIGSPAALAAAGFGVTAFSLQFSALQTLNAEGNALWILYCLPKPLERVLREKAVLWICISLIYPLAFLLCGALWLHMPLGKLAERGAVALLGVPVYALIATSLGVFACDPLAVDVRRRVRVSYVYLYMMLASVYIYAIYQGAVWPRVVLLVLTALLALALWQKAKDQLPFLLDPTSAPAPRVSLADGGIAAILFFLLQVIIMALATVDGGKVTGSWVLLAFSLAGAGTFFILRLFYWRARTTDVPRFFAGTSMRSLLWALAAGALASAWGLLYIRLIAHWQWLREALAPTVGLDNNTDLFLVMLFVVAAPLFEEFIFRGLVFGGMRRSLGRWPAIFASAMVFAAVHPPVSFPAVFGVGVCAAFVYERHRVLFAPMLVHAAYNASIVFIR